MLDAQRWVELGADTQSRPGRITVGQFVGAGGTGIIKAGLPRFAIRAALVAGLISIALALLAAPLINAFTGSTLSVEVARTYLWFMVPVSAANCCFLIYGGVYEGLGQNWPVFYAEAWRVK